MSDVQWVEAPPEKGRKRNPNPGRLQRAAAALRANPGRWALVSHYENYGTGSQVVGYFKRYGCEATQRKTEDGGVDVYARYVNGDGGAP